LVEETQILRGPGRGFVSIKHPSWMRVAWLPITCVTETPGGGAGALWAASMAERVMFSPSRPDWGDCHTGEGHGGREDDRVGVSGTQSP